MATSVKTISIGDYASYELAYDLLSQSVANNTSTIRLYGILHVTGNYISWSSASAYVHTKTQSIGTYYSTGNYTLVTGDFTFTHNSNGQLTQSVGFGLNSTFISNSSTASITLPNIPRNTSIKTFTVAKRNETSVTYNFTAAHTCDYAWYSINNGSSWTGVNITDGTSGSFVVSGLSPNTTYKFKLRVRRKDSQLTTDSSTVSQTTYKVPTQSFNAKTETSITMNWTVDSTADYIWYSKDNGSNWTAVGSVNATSGKYTISGLNANTAYNIKTRVRRKASQTTYDTTSSSQTTYNYPYITAVGTSNLTIGNSQKLTIYNPLSRNVTVRMNKDSASGTQLYSGTTTGTSFTFTPTASTLYASIPNNTSAKCVYSIIYSSQTKTTTGQYTYTINTNNCKPTFTNFAYSTNLSELTGNNDTVINGKTSITFTISNANRAIAKNSATISRYYFECGSKNVYANYSTSTVTGLLTNCSSDIIKITAIDSRGLETTVSKKVKNFKNYFIPTFVETIAERENGIDATSYLNTKLNFWNYSFGKETNKLLSLKYRVKKSTDSAYSSWFTISMNNVKINKEEATLEDYLIYVDGLGAKFTVGISYDIQLQAIDGISSYNLSTVTSSLFKLPDGKVAFSVLKDYNGEYHIGINGMPDLNNTLKVHGTISNN